MTEETAKTRTKIIKHVKPKNLYWNNNLESTGMDDIFMFGRYKGDAVDEVLENHLDYLTWLLENHPSFSFDKDMHFLYQEAIDSEREK